MLEALQDAGDAKACRRKGRDRRRCQQRARPDVVKRVTDAQGAREKPGRSRLRQLSSKAATVSRRFSWGWLLTHLGDLARRRRGPANPRRSDGETSAMSPAVKAHELVPVPPVPEPAAEVLGARDRRDSAAWLLTAASLLFPCALKSATAPTSRACHRGRRGCAEAPSASAIPGWDRARWVRDNGISKESQELRLQRAKRLCGVRVFRRYGPMKQSRRY